MPLSPATIPSVHRWQGMPTGTSTCGFISFIGEPHDSPNHRIGYQFWSMFTVLLSQELVEFAEQLLKTRKDGLIEQR